MTEPDPQALVDRRVDEAYPEVLPGVQRHVSHADAFTVLRLRLAAGATLPAHQHEHEQYVHVLFGTLAVTLGTATPVTVTLGPGDAVRLPAWLTHETRAETDAETLEVFSPRRLDLA